MNIKEKCRGGAKIFPTGDDFSDEGAKVRLIWYYKWQESPKKNSLSPSDGDLECSDVRL